MYFLMVILFAASVHGGFFNVFHLPADNSAVPFVDCQGQLTKNSSLACGVTLEFCLSQTAGSPGWTLFSWNLFVPMFATWLAPWLALTSQLPYETKQRLTNLMSLLMVLGSPHLAAYSLSLMLLNARWINGSFRQLHQQAKDISLQPPRPDQYDAFTQIRYILIEMQHIPPKIESGRDHDFAQMIVRPENSAAWRSLAKEMSKTKREKTLSLFVGLGWVVAMQVLSIIQFFTTAADDNNVVLGLAVNSLWTWMLPLVWGWVFVGTQNFAKSIGEAFQALHPPQMTVARARNPGHLTRGDSDAQNDEEARKTWCKFLVDRTDEPQEVGMETFLGLSVAGWERQPGPLFVFARVYSIRIACQHILVAFDEVRKRQKAKRPVHDKSWDENNFAANLAGTAAQIARYIIPIKQNSLQTFERGDTELLEWTEGAESSPQLTVHSGAPPGITNDFFIAALIGSVLQWGTTGSAILIAYMTPVVGFGCDSGAYLIYGVNATVVWSLEVLAAKLSHRWAKERELHPERTRPVTWCSLGAFAVYSRLAGNALAIGNALWVVFFSTVQFTNLYSNCGCTSSFRGSWSLIASIASPNQVFITASGFWIAGTFMAIACTIFCTLFFMIAKGDDLFRMDAQ